METRRVKLDCPAELDERPFFPNAANRERHAEKIACWKERMSGIMSPCCACKTLKISGVDVDEGFVQFDNGAKFLSHMMAREFTDCVEALFFVATIGPGADEESKKLTDAGELIDAYTVDSLGSVAVDAVMKRFLLDFETEMKTAGCSLSACFSPGSYDLPIEDQRKVFNIVDASLIGVELSDSFLMSPRKSVSGIVGVLPYDNHKSVLDSGGCHHCGRKDCFVRDNRNKN